MPKFVPRQRKHKVLQRKCPAHDAPSDSNQFQIVPLSKSESEEARQRLKAELRAGQTKVSGKKQKRQDKYIETKLKKDENVALLKKLENAKVDTAGFQSSKHLGKRTFKDFAEDGPTRPRPVASHQGTVEISDVESEDSFEQVNENTFGDLEGNITTAASTNTKSIGSGLKAPLAVGHNGMPVIGTRQRLRPAKNQTEAVELPWEGFDTEASDRVDDDQLGDDSNRNASGLNDREEDEDNASQSADDSDVNDDLAETSDISDASSETPRPSAFKSWATKQVHKSLGHVPSYERVQEAQPVQIQVTKMTPAPPALQAQVEDSNLHPSSTQKAFSVTVRRPQDIQDSRMNLPIAAEEQKIMEAIQNNSVVLIWGATGSGKTTQVPQFLFEGGYGSRGSPNPGMIGVTQPRRVAAVSMANRVTTELGEHGAKVAYQVRFDRSIKSETAIKFMTDGILLRELSQDVLLSKYSVIIIDEAHERSTNTDVLIGTLSRIVPLRLKMSRSDASVKPLKLVIMSATLRTSDFLKNERLFKPNPTLPPIVQVEGRQFPVTIHFARRTARDFLEEVCMKVIKGHRKLPHGSMLVFLTGQNDVSTVTQKLLQELPSTAPTLGLANRRVASPETPKETEDFDFGHSVIQHGPDDYDLITGLNPNDDEDSMEWEENGDAFNLGDTPSSNSKVHVLPLFSQLPTQDQLKVFEAPPEGSRLIVLATNVAETSLTIPGIRYVFDAGRSKERIYDHTTGVQRFETTWISKASADQRAGRAGRTGAGHCYRLYSSAVYERDFAQYSQPEILNTPIENVVLQLKNFRVENVLKFPFPTRPPRESLTRAENLLKNLGALSIEGRVTQTGTNLSLYPVSPRLSKMINVCMNLRPELIGYVVAIAAALSVGELFVPGNQIQAPGEERNSEDEHRRRVFPKARSFFNKMDPRSDVLRLLTAVVKFEEAEVKEEFCETTFTRLKAMQEVVKLRSQLVTIVRANNASLRVVTRTSLPSAKECLLLNGLVATGYLDQVAIRADLAPNPPRELRRSTRAIEVPYLPLVPIHSHPRTLADRATFLHPTSVLARLNPKELPAYVVYSHLQQSQPSLIEIEHDTVMKTRMFPLAPIRAEQLASLAHGTQLLEYSKPVARDIVLLSGNPERLECWVIPSLVGAADVTAWPLPARKVIQKRDSTVNTGWVIEKFLH